MKSKTPGRTLRIPSVSLYVFRVHWDFLVTSLGLVLGDPPRVLVGRVHSCTWKVSVSRDVCRSVSVGLWRGLMKVSLRLHSPGSPLVNASLPSCRTPVRTVPHKCLFSSWILLFIITHWRFTSLIMRLSLKSVHPVILWHSFSLCFVFAWGISLHAFTLNPAVMLCFKNALSLSSFNGRLDSYPMSKCPWLCFQILILGLLITVLFLCFLPYCFGSNFFISFYFLSWLEWYRRCKKKNVYTF